MHWFNWLSICYLCIYAAHGNVPEQCIPKATRRSSHWRLGCKTVYWWNHSKLDHRFWSRCYFLQIWKNDRYSFFYILFVFYVRILLIYRSFSISTFNAQVNRCSSLAVIEIIIQVYVIITTQTEKFCLGTPTYNLSHRLPLMLQWSLNRDVYSKAANLVIWAF